MKAFSCPRFCLGHLLFSHHVIVLRRFFMSQFFARYVGFCSLSLVFFACFVTLFYRYLVAVDVFQSPVPVFRVFLAPG